jgi:hypothetical protein
MIPNKASDGIVIKILAIYKITLAALGLLEMKHPIGTLIITDSGMLRKIIRRCLRNCSAILFP